ncbi:MULTISPECIES: DUF6801 domain-containing protein [unclassified Streptomyces]|uniref:DUF6801 domain-containing protein n=1 Tax=unclassified Streptomyces TaxID=2593676 RepID=UPI000DB96348|nr:MULTISPECIES: DUF6801 domain-containing protein [unclassified Streptomyces]
MKLEATVKVSTQAPTTAVTGHPIQIGPVQVETRLPRAELAELLPAGAELTSEATLGVEVRQNKDTADATWSGLGARSTVPADGPDITLTHTGDVSSVTVNASGVIELLARQLVLTVSPANASPVTATCSPAEDADPLLARIAVPDDPGTDPGGSSPSDTPTGKGDKSPRDGLTVTPKDEPKAEEATCGPRPSGDPDLSQVPLPPGADPAVYPIEGLQACAYAAGLATVRKQDGSMIINDPSASPALMDVNGAMQAASYPYPEDPTKVYLRLDSVGKLTLPDATSTFLGFGFVPVTAKVSFENSPITISTGNMRDEFDPFAVVTFVQTLRIRSVKVNGTSLPVGDNCRTKTPFRVTLRGKFGPDGSGSYVNVFAGGLLSGKVTIPGFTGCGVGGENLNPLFTASISGPDNLISMNQAPVCGLDPWGAFGCPPVMATLPPYKLP